MIFLTGVPPKKGGGVGRNLGFDFRANWVFLKKNK